MWLFNVLQVDISVFGSSKPWVSKKYLQNSVYFFGKNNESINYIDLVLGYLSTQFFLFFW